MKNKTLATWLTFLGGPLGLHRFYLMGFGDWLGWLLPIPTAIGLHRSLGFSQVGTIAACGWKFGRWLDIVLMEKPLGPGATTPPEDTAA